MLYGFLTALAFALWPLGRAHDVPVSALFRDRSRRSAALPRKRYVALTGLVVAALAALAVVLAYDRKIAAIFVAAAAGVFVTLRLVAMLIMALARSAAARRATRCCGSRSPTSIGPGALTPSVVLSLGLGLALLVTLLADRRQPAPPVRRQRCPSKAPSLFFLDIQDADAGALRCLRQAARRRTPRSSACRCCAAASSARNGVRAEELKAPPNAAWVLQSDRGITYADDVPAGSRVVAGRVVATGLSGPAAGLVREQDRRGARPQDRRSGRRQRARPQHHGDARQPARGRLAVARHQFRHGVFARQPSAARRIPISRPSPIPGGTTHRAGDRAAQGGRGASRPSPPCACARRSTPSPRWSLDLTLAIRGASAVTLIAAVLVLAGALAAGHRHRVYDAVVLKTLGATRARLLAAYALEYLLLGLATAVFGVAAGSLAALLVMTEVMNLSFTWLPVAGARRDAWRRRLDHRLRADRHVFGLGQKPAPVLRHL